MGRYISRVSALVATCICVCVVGCSIPPDARYVYQDGEYGVIGIPRNSTLGRKDYREQAHHLMIMHFPEGYEIVRAEEVVEGERIFEAARKLEVDSEPGVTALNQALKIGKFAKSTAIDQKDTVHITESRIIYRRKREGQPPGHDGFAAVADASPKFYIDPNEAIRKLEAEGVLLAKKEADAKAAEKKLADAKAGSKDGKPDDARASGPKDPAVQKASDPGPN